MIIELGKYPEFLDRVASEIDIPPIKHQNAVARYQAVGHWLEAGGYPGAWGQPSIYPQGSFRLGTVVRPIRRGIEADYDIDLVCEMPLIKHRTTPHEVKHMVGRRLMQHQTYRRLLDDEGRRCWTLEYAEQDGVGFHLDVLPAVPDGSGLQGTALSITHKEGASYSWSASDPKGYANWFDGKNAAAFARVVVEQKQIIQRQASLVFESVDDVPDQLVRTPLQRSIQLMKRHRDIHCNRPEMIDYAPISIIITTLAAHLYGGELDTHAALLGIVGRFQGHAALVEGRAIDPTLETMGLIRRLPDGKWYIGNPVNPDENFADRWHEDDQARARAFFSWVAALQKDLLNVQTSTNPRLLKESLSGTLGTAAVTKHFDVLVPSTGAVEPRPRIHINSPAKPWRCR
ncbi:MAG: nucleotidyltransferase [Bacteroidetes bacterium SB0662_bin_6]|nr:nucleotidyltransferase [Bacteroidetes bacterium SB0668_bin_1]MYE04645.1 nucleotidyltransferase [Bacteroidetes bacterium SB0662_bin_6]